MHKLKTYKLPDPYGPVVLLPFGRKIRGKEVPRTKVNVKNEARFMPPICLAANATKSFYDSTDQ